MAIHVRHLGRAVLLALITATPLSAQSPTDLARIRPEGSLLRHVVSTAFDRSATFRTLVDRINRSDVIVYLTCEQFTSLTLRGRTRLLSTSPPGRYLRVQIRCPETTPRLVDIVAHELQHVVEIASTPRVIDDQSFETLFHAIGFTTSNQVGCEQFETTTALDMEARVREEWRQRPAPITVAASIGLDRPSAARPALRTQSATDNGTGHRPVYDGDHR